jgi:hypothetical protein
MFNNEGCPDGQPSFSQIHFSLFSLSGNLSLLITNTPSATVILAKSPTSNPAFFNHTPAKEIEGNLRL